MALSVKALFPLGVATGAAFCDRDHERRLLRNNLSDGSHTWLWARRRMGKTSLLEQVLGELARARPAVPSVKLDLNVVHDAESLEERVRSGVERLGVALMPRGRKHVDTLMKTFERFRPEFSLGAAGTRMTLRRTEALAPGISELLLATDAAAGAYGRRGVIVLDEFQQLASLTYGKSDFTLEGAIRHAVERARQITYVFSGSQRHLLADMFENPDRPLYRLCRKMTLQRIAAADYSKFFDRASKARWGETLADGVSAAILARTRRHPYYVNALCTRLWRADTPPDERAIDRAWLELAGEDEAIVAQQVRALSATQRAMLVGIAQAGTLEHPTGRAFLAAVRLSASTGAAAKDVLEAEDLIRQNRDGLWELVDPVMEQYIRSHT